MRGFASLLIMIAGAGLCPWPAGAGHIGLAWDPLPDKPDCIIKAYHVYFGTSSASYDTDVAAGKVSAFDVDVGGDCDPPGKFVSDRFYLAIKARSAADLWSRNYSNEVYGHPRPEVTAIDRSAATQGASVPLLVSGINFLPGSKVELVDAAGLPAAGVTLAEAHPVDCRRLEMTLQLGSSIRGQKRAQVGTFRVRAYQDDGEYSGAHAVISLGGPSFAVLFDPAFADVNQDSLNDCADMELIRYFFGYSEGDANELDLNGDGAADAQDLRDFHLRDLSGDGWVDGTDISLLIGAFSAGVSQECQRTALRMKSYRSGIGDFNLDGQSGCADVDLLERNFGRTRYRLVNPRTQVLGFDVNGDGARDARDVELFDRIDADKDRAIDSDDAYLLSLDFDNSVSQECRERTDRLSRRNRARFDPRLRPDPREVVRPPRNRRSSAGAAAPDSPPAAGRSSFERREERRDGSLNSAVWAEENDAFQVPRDVLLQFDSLISDFFKPDNADRLAPLLDYIGNVWLAPGESAERYHVLFARLRALDGLLAENRPIAAENHFWLNYDFDDSLIDESDLSLMLWQAAPGWFRQQHLRVFGRPNHLPRDYPLYFGGLVKHEKEK